MEGTSAGMKSYEEDQSRSAATVDDDPAGAAGHLLDLQQIGEGELLSGAGNCHGRSDLRGLEVFGV